jgi:probable phosphoglycerate mutase
MYNEGRESNMVEIPKTRICLVRHGETEWNADRRIQGWIDIDLNPIGRAQSAAAGSWLRNAGIVALYSSDLKRAWATAQAIGAALGLSPVAARELRERRYGIFEGLTYDEARVRFPDDYAAFARRDADYGFDGGESLKQMFARVTGKLDAIAAAHPRDNVAVVVHGGVLDIVNHFVRGNPLEMPRDFLIPNAGISWIAAVHGVWTLESWGETGHLEPGARDELPT